MQTPAIPKDYKNQSHIRSNHPKPETHSSVKTDGRTEESYCETVNRLEAKTDNATHVWNCFTYQEYRIFCYSPD